MKTLARNILRKIQGERWRVIDSPKAAETSLEMNGHIAPGVRAFAHSAARGLALFLPRVPAKSILAQDLHLRRRYFDPQLRDRTVREQLIARIRFRGARALAVGHRDQSDRQPKFRKASVV